MCGNGLPERNGGMVSGENDAAVRRHGEVVTFSWKWLGALLSNRKRIITRWEVLEGPFHFLLQP
jgi:hypothetical protein